ncbi:MAG: zinc metalloprotease HtpX [Sulfolobaceae archaeon]|nr:zinc metalloprotease HtpX [Sulfolobaceae archaeon]
MNLTVAKLKIEMLFAALGIIILGFAVAYAVVGYFFGYTVAPSLITGLLIFVAFFNIIQWLFGPYLINAMYKATEVTPDDPHYGWLVDVVKEVAQANGLSTPKVYIANVSFPNAFAYGSPIAGKRVAITYPLLRMLNKDEIKAVLGHELGHLRHRDVEVLMAVGLIPALLYWLGYSLMWGGIFSGGEGRDNGGIMMLFGIILLAVSYLFQFLVLFLNRLREAYADVNSVLTVPNGAINLERALAKITLAVDPSALDKYRKKNQIVSMLFFTGVNYDIPDTDVDSLIEYWRNEKVPWYADFFSDHPHPAKRIQLIEKVAGYR